MKLNYYKENTVIGRYEKCILAQKELQKHTGQYKIVVNDTLEIVLLPPYKPESLRPPEEVAQMEGELVKVTGIVVQQTSFEEPTLEDEPLSVDIPCFISISNIELVK